MTPAAFSATLKTYNIQVSQAQMDQFELYFKRLVQVNQQVNLTAITEQEAVYLKHFFDSVTPTLYLEKLRTEPSRSVILVRARVFHRYQSKFYSRN